MPSRNWLRAGILVATILPLLAVAWIAGISRAQQPPFPPGSMPRGPGNPPGFPGGNMPNTPPNQPPGFPGNTPGNMPNSPNMPGPTIPGPPEMIWTCSNCKKEVGRGPFKPDLANCPFCGVRIGNTMAGMQANSQDRMNQAMNRNAGSPGPVGPASSSTSASRFAITGVFALLAGLVVIVIVVVAIVGAVFLFKTTPKARRVRRASRYRDEY
ncbi:MAG TPA: hypothetical protein VGZ47_17735 [Gemmataceae bacterium]|jgi:hypothetical protein|nr:hypothetical protein [Gemmataceae bacterium]